MRLNFSLNVLFWNFRGIHQIGLSQCESKTLEGCFGRCGSPHWRRWLLPISYHQVLIGTTESSYGYHHLALVTSWVRLGITELYWKSPSYTSCCYSGHGIGKELALRLADLGCLVVCVDRLVIYHMSSVEEKETSNLIKMKCEIESCCGQGGRN